MSETPYLPLGILVTNLLDVVYIIIQSISMLPKKSHLPILPKQGCVGVHVPVTSRARTFHRLSARTIK